MFFKMFTNYETFIIKIYIMNSNKVIFIWTLIISLIFSSKFVHAQSIQIGEAELIYTEDEIPIRYDGSLSTIKKDDQNIYFFHSFGCRLEPESGRRSRHSWHYGPPLDPLKVHYFSKT